MKKTRRERAWKELLEKKPTNLGEAVQVVKKTASAKFDESVDIAFNLGVDPRKAEQLVRGVVDLPHGVGKPVRVLALVKGEKTAEAKQAGADDVGAEDMIAKIQAGWLEFDRVVATPDMMAMVSKVGKVLGPRGLMPNPRTGSVTTEVGKAIGNIKKGQVEFRVDKAGVLHAPVGRASFDESKLKENILAVVEVVKRLRPASAKGVYMQKIALSSTMGPGIALEPTALT